MTAPKKNSNKPITMDHLRSTKKPQTYTTWIVSDYNLVDEYEALTAMVEEARKRYGLFPDMEGVYPELARLEDELEELIQRMRDSENSIKFVFQSIGSKRYEDLVAAHPVTEATRKKLDEMGVEPGSLSFEVDTFAPALIAASCIEPKLTEEFVLNEMVGGEDGAWSQSEIKQLYGAALEANVRMRNVELGKGFKKTRHSTKS